MSATIDFTLFPFQIGASNAVVVSVHHSSFGKMHEVMLNYSDV